MTPTVLLPLAGMPCSKVTAGAPWAVINCSRKFLVINGGPSEVDVLTVDIAWPHQVENGRRQGKWLLYLTDHPQLKNGRGDCFLPPGYQANPLNLTAGHDGITARHVSLSLKAQEEMLMQESGNNLLFRDRPRREIEKVGLIPHCALSMFLPHSTL